MKKRWLSLLLCLSFVLALVPTAAMAADDAADPLQPDDLYYSLAGESTDGEEPDITLHKTAVDNGDDTYDITLTAEAKQKVTIKDTEVAFVLDASGSMNWCTENLTGVKTNFRGDVEYYYDLNNKGHKHAWNEKSVPYCSLMGETIDGVTVTSRWAQATEAIHTVEKNLGKDVTKHFVYFSDRAKSAADSNYTGVSPYGSTSLSAGVKKGIEQLNDTSKKRVLIIVADGESNDGYPDSEIRAFKDAGGIVYTVGFTFSNEKFEALASENGNYTANNADELKVAMDEITTKVAGLISDPMGDGVELVPGTVKVSGEGYENSEQWTSEDGRTIYWTNKDGLNKKVTLTYTVKLTDATKEAAKENGMDVPLNKNATLNFDGTNGAVQVPFPVPVAHVDPEPKMYTLTYVSNGGTEFADETYKEGTEVTIDKQPTREGYVFKGWYADEKLTEAVSKVTMNSDKTVYAKWAKLYTLTYVSNGGTDIEPQQYEDGSTAMLDDIPTKTDYQFTGWYEDEACTTLVESVIMDKNRTVYAGWKKDETPVLKKDDHSAYIIGYDDGTVRPEQSISRAEVATIFFRLLNDETREQYWADTNDYSDVADNVWYTNAISTLSKMGILTGYEDGTFKPDASVTRAEFATIAARFSDGELKDFASFPDVPEDHWASQYIAKAEKLGWIKGYDDGTFGPENEITRAQAMTLVNRVLERGVDEEGICENTIQWSDNLDTTAWYYYDVQEATNSHFYVRTDREIKDQTFCYEKWTELKENRNWADLEQAWKDAFANK